MTADKPKSDNSLFKLAKVSLLRLLSFGCYCTFWISYRDA